jgi:hypothetical protein
METRVVSSYISGCMFWRTWRVSLCTTRDDSSGRDHRSDTGALFSFCIFRTHDKQVVRRKSRHFGRQDLSSAFPGTGLATQTNNNRLTGCFDTATVNHEDSPARDVSMATACPCVEIGGTRSHRRGMKIYRISALPSLTAIPGLPKGQDPDSMHTGLKSTHTDFSRAVAGRCSWFQGSRASPAPRNDEGT